MSTTHLKEKTRNYPVIESSSLGLPPALFSTAEEGLGALSQGKAFCGIANTLNLGLSSFTSHCLRIITLKWCFSLLSNPPLVLPSRMDIHSGSYPYLRETRPTLQIAVGIPRLALNKLDLRNPLANSTDLCTSCTPWMEVAPR